MQVGSASVYKASHYKGAYKVNTFKHARIGWNHEQHHAGRSTETVLRNDPSETPQADESLWGHQRGVHNS